MHECRSASAQILRPQYPSVVFTIDVRVLTFDPDFTLSAVGSVRSSFFYHASFSFLLLSTANFDGF